VRAIAFELNLPELLTRFEKLGPRLKIIFDDSDDKDEPAASESQSAARLIKKKAQVVRQHMVNLQHHKSIGVRGPGINKVLYGSTNFTWRGFYVQSNNAVIVNSKKAVNDYFAAFDDYFTAKNAAGAPKMPVDSHVRLAHPQFNKGAELLRRGYNFVDGSDGLGRLDAGLFFLAYQRDPRKQFIPIQNQLAKNDTMNEYIHHVGSGIFACPAGVTPGSYWGEKLFS